MAQHPEVLRHFRNVRMCLADRLNLTRKNEKEKLVSGVEWSGVKGVEWSGVEWRVCPEARGEQPELLCCPEARCPEATGARLESICPEASGTAGAAKRSSA